MIEMEEYLLEKYARQIIMNEVGLEGQKKIFDTSICIIGCGGLGTTASQYLTMSGISKLTLIDNDHVNLSNLNRQTLFTENDIGKSKSMILADKLKKINKNSNITFSTEKVTKVNIGKYIKENNIILDCTDNFESRLIINEYCHIGKKVLVSAAIQNFDIQIFVSASWKGKSFPCYKCIFPNLEENNNESCDEMGIISSVAGMGGLIQANMVLNLILGLKENFNELILFDCAKIELKKIIVKKNKKCKVCCT